MTSSTVVFTLQGPMQAWAAQPTTRHRPTSPAPTKTGVIGLVANALGRDRADTIDDLAALRIAVRHDQPGSVEQDMRTIGSGAMPVLPAELHALPTLAKTAEKHGIDQATRPYTRVTGEKTVKGRRTPTRGKNAVIGYDYYLTDAAFTVALEGDSHIVAGIADALHSPARPLYLGRKSYPVATPLNPEQSSSGLLAALTARPIIGGADPDTVTTTIEDDHGTWIDDQPVHFGTRHRSARRHRTIPPTRTTAPTSTPLIDFFSPQGPRP